MNRSNFVTEVSLKKRLGVIIDAYTKMCDTYEDVQRSTVYCNYCGTYIYDGHTEECQAYDTGQDFMKQVRDKAKRTLSKS